MFYYCRESRKERKMNEELIVEKSIRNQDAVIFLFIHEDILLHSQNSRISFHSGAIIIFAFFDYLNSSQVIFFFSQEKHIFFYLQKSVL